MVFAHGNLLNNIKIIKLRDCILMTSMALLTSNTSELRDVTDEDMEIARELLFFSKMCDYSIFQLKNRSEFMRVDYMDFKSQKPLPTTFTRTSYPTLSEQSLAEPISYFMTPSPEPPIAQPAYPIAQPAYQIAPSWASNVLSQNLRKISFADFYYCKREYTDLLMKNQKRDSQKIFKKHHELCALALCGALRTDGSEREKWVEEYDALRTDGSEKEKWVKEYNALTVVT